MDKLTKRFMLILLLISLLVRFTLAIGISPGSTTIDYEPGAHHEINFKIHNLDSKQMKVLFNVEGELAPYVTLHESSANFSPDEKIKSFSYEVNLPNKIEKPGTHIAKIIAVELPPDIEQSETYMGIISGVVSRLEVRVPFPEKYAEAELSVSGENVNEPVIFLVKVHNLGEEDIEKLQASIEIFDPANDKIATIVSDEESIASMSLREFKIQWVPQDPGSYRAKTTVHYDDETTIVEKDFYVSGAEMELLDVNVENFRLGGVAEFRLLVENRLNDIVKNVYADITIYDQKNEKIGQFESVSLDIPSLERSTLRAYWDTVGVKSGAYGAAIIINYADGKKIERQFQAVVSLDKIKLSLVGAKAQFIPESGPIVVLITLLVVILILINAIWFVYFKRKAKK